MGLGPLEMVEDDPELEKKDYDCKGCPKIRDIWDADFDRKQAYRFSQYNERTRRHVGLKHRKLLQIDYKRKDKKYKKLKDKEMACKLYKCRMKKPMCPNSNVCPTDLDLEIALKKRNFWRDRFENAS